MKKLLASLLFLPFLLGVNVGTALPGDFTTPMATGASTVPGLDIRVIEAPAAVSSIAAPAAQPSLPGHLATGALTGPTFLIETGSTGTWRAPTRSMRSPAGPLHPAALTARTRTHISTVQRRVLEFEHTLARAHASRPATFGNPPPASTT